MQNFLRIAAPLFAARHVFHFDVRAFTQPILKFFGVRWGGTPAKPVRLWFRELTLLRKLAESKDLKLDHEEDGSTGSGK